MGEMGKIESFQINGMCVKSATKLMEQLNVNQNGVPDVKISEIKNIYPFGNDKSEMFIVAEDKSSSVHIYKIDDIDGNLSVLPTGLSGHNTVAGLDKENKICVFTVKGNRVLYVEETAPSTCEFSKPKELNITYPVYGSTIDKLIIHSLNDDSRFPFVLAVVFKSGEKYWIDLIYWGLSEDIFFNNPLTSPCFTFSGSTRQTLKLKVLGENYAVYDMYKNKLDDSLTVNWHDENAECLSLKEAAGSSFVLHQSGDIKKISVLVPDSETKGFCIQTLFSDSNLHCFDVWEDKNSVSLSVHTDTIRHSTVQLLSEGEWDAGTFIPLADNSYMLRSLYYNRSMHLFYIDKRENALYRLEDMDGEGWNETKYEEVSRGSVTLRACYSTEVTITDEIHKTKPLSGVEVKLFAESRAYVETSEGTAVIDGSNYITLKTDAKGKLFFRQYCSRLDVPVLYMEFVNNNVSDDPRADKSVIAFSQFSDIKNALSKIDVETLLNAQQFDSKTGKTSPLISDEYRDKKKLDDIAESIRSLFQQFDTGDSTVMSIKNENKFDLGMTVSNKASAWSLEFLEDGRTVFERLSHDAAEEKIRLLKCEDTGMPNWMTKIGDFFRAVAKSIVKVCDVIVNGVEATVKFIINGVEMIFKTVISAVKDILKVVEIILKPIAVTFEHVFRWLASLVGWNYVLYTKRAIKNTIEFFMDLIPEKADELCDELCKKIKESQSKIDDLLDNVIHNIDPNSTCMDNIEKNIPNELLYAYELSNDPLQAKLMQMAYSGKMPEMMTEDTFVSDRINEVFEKLKKFTELRNSEDFKNAEEYFKSAFTDMDNFYSFILSGLISSIKGIFHAIMDGCVEVISALISVFKEIMSALKKIITANIELPLFSEIYLWLSDGKMSLLDMSSLIIALPVTITGKCFLGEVPFSSEEDADAFVEDIRSRFGGRKKNAVFNSVERNVSSKNQILCKIMMTLSAQTSESFNIFSDALSLADSGTAKAGNVFGSLSLAAELLWFGMASPTLYMTDDEEEYDFAMDLWYFFGLGCTLDIFLTYMLRIEKLDNIAAKIIKCFYGIAHIVIASVGMYLKTIPSYAFAAEFGAAVIEIIGVLFLTEEPTTIVISLVIEFAAAYVILISNIVWCKNNDAKMCITNSWNNLLPT